MSCATPVPVSRLEPVHASNSYWLNGTEMVIRSQDSLEIEMGYNHRKGNLYAFDVTITNYGTTPVLVDPTTFFYRPVTKHGDTLTIVWAENPETNILNQEITISRFQAQRSNKSTSGLLFGTMELAVDISSSDSESNHNSVLEQTEEEIATIDAQINSAENQIQHWESQALRKTTLFPDHYLQGQVYFKWTSKAKIIAVFIPIDNVEFEFTYQQTLHKKLSVNQH